MDDICFFPGSIDDSVLLYGKGSCSLSTQLQELGCFPPGDSRHRPGAIFHVYRSTPSISDLEKRCSANGNHEVARSLAVTFQFHVWLQLGARNTVPSRGHIDWGRRNAKFGECGYCVNEVLALSSGRKYFNGGRFWIYDTPTRMYTFLWLDRFIRSWVCVAAHWILTIAETG